MLTVCSNKSRFLFPGSGGKVEWLEGGKLDSEEEKNLLSFTQAFQIPPFILNPQHPPATSAPENLSCKAFRCALCNYSVDRSDSLKRHMRLHTGNMFRCDECGLQYNSRHNLVTHHRKKHGGDGGCGGGGGGGGGGQQEGGSEGQQQEQQEEQQSEADVTVVE
ncbi:hypothetical protein ACOMHN_028565 [Nucella lapillus]